jgi:hypothetical protein
MRLIPALILLSAAPAQAACQPDSEIFACQIGSKTLEVCHDGDALVYRFGPHAAPELTLSEPLATVDYQPWSGFGRNRFYTVTFRNGGVAYQVWSGFDRNGSPRGNDGGVTVRDGSAVVVELTCDWGSVTRELDSIGFLKSDIGQCFDQEHSLWREGECGRNPAFCACPSERLDSSPAP